MDANNARRIAGIALACLAAGSLAAAASATGFAADRPAGGVPGHAAPGRFDLDRARADQQALASRLLSVLPPGAQASPVRVEVSAAERAAIGLADEVPGRIRVGLVKALPEPVRFTSTGMLAPGGLPAGQLATGPDGGYVWAVTLHAPEATAVRPHFGEIDLGAGAELFLLGSDGEAHGPYTGRGHLGTGELWAHTVAGDAVTVVLAARGSKRPEPSRLTISELGYLDYGSSRLFQNAWRSLQGGQSNAFCNYNASCVQNASCGVTPAMPSAIETARDAYAHMEFASGPFLYYCSGGLLATNPPDSTPYFLTARHCISKNNEASSLQAFFQYTVACNAPCPSPPFWNQEPYPRTLGSTIKKSGNSSDFTLLLLSQAAPGGSHFLGWDKTPVANTNGTALYRISHPSGAPQSYSTHSVSTSRPTCSGWPRGAWIYSNDIYGATEGGSSGSPVLKANGQVVGQLSGACGYNVNNPCDSVNNATVDGAFANYYCQVQPFLYPADTSCGGGGGGGGGNCTPSGGQCTEDSQCCSGKCKGNGLCR